MPNGINGIELARYASKHHPGIRVLLVSGYPLPALRAEHGSLDEFTLLSKPYRLSDLAKTLRAASDQDGGR